MPATRNRQRKSKPISKTMAVDQISHRTSVAEDNGDDYAHTDHVGGDQNIVKEVQDSIFSVGRNAKTIVRRVNQYIQQLPSPQDEKEKSRHDAIKRLARGVINYTEELVQAIADPSTNGAGPYKELQAYTLTDAEIFYGRDSAIREMFEHMNRDKLTIIQSESGAGKSSLLQAGIAPKLLEKKHLPVQIKSYDQSLILKIKQKFVSDVKTIPELYEMSLQGFLREVIAALGKSTKLYLFLDQFERFLISPFHEETVIDFINALTECLEDDQLRRVYWVISLRYESFGKLAAKIAVTNHYWLDRLHEDEAKEIITRPANRYKVIFEDSLVEEILKSVRNQDNTHNAPQIQLVCSTLYRKLKEKLNKNSEYPHIITLKLYEDAGKTEGILGDHLNWVLDNTLDSKQELEIAHQILIELTSSDQKQRVRRTYDDLANALTFSRNSDETVDYISKHLGKILGTLYEQRLLSIERDNQTKESTYELIHDYLLQEIQLSPEVRAQKAAQEMLDRGVIDFERQGFLLSADRFEHIHRYRNSIRKSEAAVKLLERSLEKYQTEHDKQLKQAQELASAKEAERVAEARARQEAEEKLVAEQKVRDEANERAIAEHARADAEKKARQESELRETEEHRRAKSEEKARQEAEHRATAEQQRANAESQRAKSERQRRIITTIATVLIGLFAISVVVLLQRETWARSAEAQQRKQALINDSERTATLAKQQLTLDPIASLYLALNALPNLSNERPYVAEAEFVLVQAIRASLERDYRDFHKAGGGPLTPKQVAFGSTYVAVGGDGIRLLNYAFTETIILTAHLAEVKGVQWNKTTDEFLSYDDHSLRVWRWDSHMKKYRQGPEYRANPPSVINCAEWRPNQQQIAVCTSNELWLWSTTDITQTNEATRTFVYSSSSPLRTAWWSPDRGNWLATWDNQRQLLTMDMQDNKQLTATFPTSVTITTMVWSSDTQHLAIAENGSVWTINGIEKPDLRLAGGDDKAVWPFYDHTKKKPMLLISPQHGLPQIWDSELLQKQSELSQAQGKLVTAAWHPSGDYIATGDMDGTVQIWRKTGEPVITLHGHKSVNIESRADVFGLYWQDNQYLITVGEDGSVRRWQVFDSRGSPLCSNVDPDGVPRCVDADSIADTGSNPIVSADWQDDDTIVVYRKWEQGMVWNLKEKSQISPIKIPISYTIGCNNPLITAQTNEIDLVDPKTGATISSLKGYHGSISAAAFSPQGRLAIAETNGVVWIWEPGKGVSSFSFSEGFPLMRLSSVTSLQWSQDSKRLLVAGSQIALWEVDPPQQLWSLNTNNKKVCAVFSPNEEYIATSVLSMTVVNASTGNILWQLPDHAHIGILGVAWSKGKVWNYQGSWPGSELMLNSEERLLLLTWGPESSSTSSARLWDWESGSEIMRMPENGIIEHVAVSPNGQYILTAALTNYGMTGTLRVWRSWHQDPDALLNVAQSQITRNLSPTQLEAFALSPTQKSD